MKTGIKKQKVKFIVTDEYREWIALIKDRIKNSQIKASIKVNRELLELYWHIGEDIVNRQKHSKWGEGLLRQMSIDLKNTFPDMAGIFRNEFENDAVMVSLLCRSCKWSTSCRRIEV